MEEGDVIQIEGPPRTKGQIDQVKGSQGLVFTLKICKAFNLPPAELGYGHLIQVKGRSKPALTRNAPVPAPALPEVLTGPIDLIEISRLALVLARQQYDWSLEELGARFDEVKRSVMEMSMQEMAGDAMSRRQALTLLCSLPVALLGLTAEGSNVPLFAEDLLPLCATSIPACWELHFDGGDAEVERVLPTYLSQLSALAQEASPHQKMAAGLASQAYQLACDVAKYHESFGHALTYCKQALMYAEVAEDANLQVASLIRRADVHFHRNYPTYVLQAYQETLPLLDYASPLLRGRVYAGLASTCATLGQKEQALRYMGLAKETYPAHPETDPTFLYAHHSHYSFYIHGEGLPYLSFGQAKEASRVFTYIEKHVLIPQKMAPQRVGLLRYQADCALALSDLEQSCFTLQTAAQLAQRYGYRVEYNKAFDIYQKVQTVWPDEKRVQGLAELFQPW